MKEIIRQLSISIIIIGGTIIAYYQDECPPWVSWTIATGLWISAPL